MRSNYYIPYYSEDEKEEWIDEACKYISENAPIDYDCEGFVEEFRQVMKEKLKV